LAEAVEKYRSLLKSGSPDERAAFRANHVDLGPALYECLDALDFLEAAGQGLHSDAPRGLLPDPHANTVVLGTLGDFRILREVGRGGMGIVYEAEQISLHRRVALKVLPFAATMDPRHLQRFKNESLAAASLEHPHIVPVYAVGCERGVHYYAMKYIEGQSLAEVIDEVRKAKDSHHRGTENTEKKQNTKISSSLCSLCLGGSPDFFKSVAELGIQAAEALEHAHSVGIVHRDIKPANLMTDSQGKLWITDFGLARTTADAGLTMTGDVPGTLRYMSPEQALAKHGLVDHRTDVYSLGVTLYELLTGTPAINGKDREQILNALTLDEPRPPRDLDAAIPHDLETILLKAMAREPAERYTTAKELADDLRRFLEHRSILARRPSWLQCVRKWVRRHQAVVTATSLTLAAALAVSAALIWREHGGTLSALHDAEVQRGRAEERELLVRKYLYPADMKVAHQAWMNSDLRLLREVLSRHIPEPGQEDLRGFDWDYLWRLAHLEALTLEGHTGEVYHVAFSRDGKWLATASQDKTIRLWETLTGQLVRIYTGHAGEVNWTSFSPNGTTLVSASSDGTVRLWDVASGRNSAILKDHSGEVVAAEFSPDGTIIASGGADKMVKLWDTATGRLRATLPGHTSRVESLTFTADGQKLFSCGREGAAFLWEVPACLAGDRIPPRGRRIQPAAGVEPVLSVAVAPDGRTLALGCGGTGAARLWDFGTGKEKGYLEHKEWLDAVAFSPDGRSLATGCRDSGVRLYDLAKDPFVKDEAGADRRGILYDPSNSATPTALGHTGGVWSVAFSPNGEKLASAGADGLVQIWDVARIYQRRLLLQQSSHVQTLAFSPDGHILATNSIEGGARLWDAHTGQLRLNLSRGNATRPPTDAGSGSGWTWPSLAFNPDGKTLLISNWQGKLETWNPASGQLAAEWPIQVSSPCLALSPDGTRLAAGPHSAWLQLWDTASREALQRIGQQAPAAFYAMAFSSDGKTLAVGGKFYLLLFEVTTGRLQAKFSDTTYCLAFSPDGRTLVTGSGAGVKIRNALTGEVQRTLLGHRPGQAINSVALSADGQTLATSCQDRTIRLWNMATGQELFILAEFPEQMMPGALTFSPDGKTLAAAVHFGEESLIYLWPSEEEARSRANQPGVPRQATPSTGRQ
jgi:WD40 repeat protein/serine/threonine protein kinase